MIRIFPRVTKCRFYKYGPSANIETIDALCLLPLNIVNEKIYIFLWFWFLLLALLTAALIFYRMIIIACPPVRVYLLSLRFKLGSLDHLHTIVRRMSVGDWFLGKWYFSIKFFLSLLLTTINWINFFFLSSSSQSICSDKTSIVLSIKNWSKIWLKKLTMIVKKI